MTDYSTWSLEDLKQAAESSRAEPVHQAARYFATGALTMTDAQDGLMATINSMQSAWKGKAAQAAMSSAQSSYRNMELTRASATQAQTTSNTYSDQFATQQAKVRAIPNVDTSWGHAAKSGWWGGAVGVGVAKYEQQKKYDHNRAEAAKVVQQMDSDGQTQAATMRSMSWPTGRSMNEAPQRSLPPVPGSGGRGAPGSMIGSSGYSPSGAKGSPGYTTIMPGPGTHTRIPDPPKGPKGPKGPGQGTTIQGGPPTGPEIPTGPQGADGSTTPTGAAGGGGPAAEPPTVAGGGGTATGSSGGAGAAGGLLGGAGLLGAGALGGRGGGGFGGLAGEGDGVGGRGVRGGTGVGEGEGTGVRGGVRGGTGVGEGEGTGVRGGVRGGTGVGDGEGTGLRGGLRGGTGVGEGEGTGLRSGLRGGSGVGEGEGTGLRGGARGVGGVPEDELGAPRRGLLGSGAPEGFAGEPVAAEAGRMGGYPMSGAGGRRQNDDEEAPMPDYLQETDDVWGDGASAAPPVIGE